MMFTNILGSKNYYSYLQTRTPVWKLPQNKAELSWDSVQVCPSQRPGFACLLKRGLVESLLCAFMETVIYGLEFVSLNASDSLEMGNGKHIRAAPFSAGPAAAIGVAGRNTGTRAVMDQY